ncbi:hypothetical protein [Magnetospirillum sp. 15-1]|uniref:hypothetical protein n=1 Tax=Magnetospirillum sp. 15-1 TaxID=1979370 RepID=UPI0014825F9E|nr:hypothetical protein [Magnetospirillum sp. 15-1]
MYVLTPPNRQSLVIDDRAVPLEPRTACERMLAKFLAEHAVHWQSRFPLIMVDVGE